VKTRWLRILLVVIFAVVALGIGYARHDADAGSAGSHYAPAESLAGPMSDEWRDFADKVDQTCARNFNAMQVDLANTSTDSDGWHVQYLHELATYREVQALGEPPARPGLLHRWLANVRHRAELMETISQALATGDQTRAKMAEERIPAAKIDANWIGQHFGLRICTSNGPDPDSGPGKSQQPYLRRVDHVCLWRNKREDIYSSRSELTPARILVLSRSETVAIAAIPTPPEQYGLRRRILSLKKNLDRVGTRLFNEAQRHSPKFKRFWAGVAEPRLNAELDRVQIALAKIGLPDCGNYGPTPASTLLPRN
jgi:hypothetical protein